MRASKADMENTKFSVHEYDGMVMSSLYPVRILDKIKETAFHDEDIVVATYPKCGTTWMQQIVFMVQNDGDAKTSENIEITDRWHFIELGSPDQYDKWASTPPPHLIKTHLSSNFFAKTLNDQKTKFIVVFRNPKDMLVSYYHFYRSNLQFSFNGTWDEFFQLFKDKQLHFGDYFDVQLSWWRLRDDPRILIMKYEGMLKEPEDAIRQVMKHMGRSLSDEAIRKISLGTSFKAMKANPLTNRANEPLMREDISPFIRKGQVGDWRNFFSEEQAKYVDRLSATLLEPEGICMEDQ